MFDRRQTEAIAKKGQANMTEIWPISLSYILKKQARKSSEDTHFTEYARFKKFGLGKLWVKNTQPHPPTPPTNFGKSYPDTKLKHNWGPLSSTFHVEQPETLIEWKFKSITNGPTDILDG